DWVKFLKLPSLSRFNRYCKVVGKPFFSTEEIDMKQLFSTAFLATVAVLGFTQMSDAHGGLFRRGGGGCCEAPCAPAPCAVPEVKWEERKVKVAKTVMKEKEIEVMECRRVTREEKYNYTVSVPVMKEEKRKVIVCTPVSKEVDVVYTVMTPK